MKFRILASLTGIAICLFLIVSPIGAQKRKNNAEPKSQVTPLPPEPPMALVVDTDSLDFHISPLLKTGGLSAQIKQSLNELLRNTHGETIVKLRAFVAGSGDARRVQARVADLFTEHHLPLPVLTIIQVGALGQESAQVVIEAVVSTHRPVNQNGLAFFFDQRGKSLQKAVEQFRANAEAAGVPPENILSCTCFAARIEDHAEALKQVKTLFPKSELNLVQAIRDPLNDAASCEGVAQLSSPPKDPVVLKEFAHATLVHSQQLIFTGLQLSFGNYLDDAQQAFKRLERAARALEPLETPVQVTGFALDGSSAAALRKTIPLAPGTFSIHGVEGLPSVDASAGIEAILAPNVQAAVVQRKKGEEAGTILHE
jgi:enamine deaminase RidA (YjgF/YER057c/UK114 family)